MRGTQRSVVVVGAGLAGLVAAQRLKSQGFQVAVIDRAKRAGGRAASTRAEGFVLEAVPPVLSPGDRRLLGWIGDFFYRAHVSNLELLKERGERGEPTGSDWAIVIFAVGLFLFSLALPFLIVGALFVWLFSAL